MLQLPLSARNWIGRMTEMVAPASRRDGWTWAKEIVGTCIGVATVMSFPTAWLFKSITDTQQSLAIHEIRLKKLEESNAEGKKADEKVQDQLSKIYDLVQDVRVQQARSAPR